MPAPVVPWVTQTFPTAKSLNLALYTCDGTSDNPHGIFFHSYRPTLFESYGTAATFGGASGGSQSSMSSPGPATSATTRGLIWYDMAGYFGQYSDMPGNGFYQFQSATRGSSGDGITPGGWKIVSHFAAFKKSSTNVSISADLLGTNVPSVSGTKQAASSTTDTCAFFLDLINTGSNTWNPAVTVRDSSGSGTTVVNTTDSSGETCRCYSIWAAVSSTSSGNASFNQNGIYSWTAPAGVTSVTVKAIGAGGGGGAGGGANVTGTVTVTPTNNYDVTVGAGGIGGTVGVSSGVGGVGASSVFPGDAVTISANGGYPGTGATVSANGAGGLGGTVPVLGGYFKGGAGVIGKTAAYGGGGGSSAG